MCGWHQIHQVHTCKSCKHFRSSPTVWHWSTDGLVQSMEIISKCSQVCCYPVLSSSVATRKQLYLSLVKSKLSYCSQLWRPRLIKDIRNFERIQRRATKFILQDYSHDYKTKLLSLNLLPLMHWYELQDMICFKNPMDNLIIHDYVKFVTSTTRASSNGKLRHKFCQLSTPRHFYFNRIVRLWNLFPWIDLSLSLPSIKHLLLNHYFVVKRLLKLWCQQCMYF